MPTILFKVERVNEKQVVNLVKDVEKVIRDGYSNCKVRVREDED